jgi:hypothetical protein
MGKTVQLTLLTLAFIAALMLWASVTTERLSAGQAGVIPSAQDVRFELLGNEPIAAPDGRALVTGWSVVMFKDRKSDRCYVAFKHEGAISVDSAVCAESR